MKSLFLSLLTIFPFTLVALANGLSQVIKLFSIYFNKIQRFSPYCLHLISIGFFVSCGVNSSSSMVPDDSDQVPFNQNNYQNKSTDSDLNALIGFSERKQDEIGMFFDKKNVVIEQGVELYLLYVCDNPVGLDVYQWTDCHPLAQIPKGFYHSYQSHLASTNDKDINGSDDETDTKKSSVVDQFYYSTDLQPLSLFLARMSRKIAEYDSGPIMEAIQAQEEYFDYPGLGRWIKTWENISWGAFSLLLARHLIQMFFGWWLIPPSSNVSQPLNLPTNFLGRIAKFAQKFSINHLLHSQKVHFFLTATLLLALPVLFFSKREYIKRSPNPDPTYSFYDDEPQISYTTIMSHAIGPDSDKFLELKNMDYTAIIFSLAFDESGYQRFEPRK